MDWNTNEVINWFLNDEYLYSQRKSGFRNIKELWINANPNQEVDMRKVDWKQVSIFLREEE